MRWPCRQFDVVVACDNSVPHLLTDDDILLALRQLYALAHPGGGCLITVRGSDREAQGPGRSKLPGGRGRGGRSICRA